MIIDYEGRSWLIIYFLQERLLQEWLDQKCLDIASLETPLTRRLGCSPQEKVIRYGYINKTKWNSFSLTIIWLTFIFLYFLADKIQISKTTWMMLSMQGGFVTEERGLIEVKVRIDIYLNDYSVSIYTITFLKYFSFLKFLVV